MNGENNNGNINNNNSSNSNICDAISTFILLFACGAAYVIMVVMFIIEIASNDLTTKGIILLVITIIVSIPVVIFIISCMVGCLCIKHAAQVAPSTLADMPIQDGNFNLTVDPENGSANVNPVLNKVKTNVDETER